MQQQQGGQNQNPGAQRQDFTQLTAGGTPVVGEFNEGDVIGGSYRVISWIGAGGMGNVYRVVHTMMGTEYALKTLSADKVTDVAWRRFQNEAQAIARMNHPNIVTIYNLDLHEGRLPFYVMDILHGDTMLDYLRDYGPMPVPMAIDLFIEIAAGLGYAHKKGIVHRDIKPPNIVLLANPDAAARVKIVDFGIAKLSGVKDPQNQFLTTAGEVCGSPYYMSPEQTAGQRIDARSDIYSLGCTLFEILTGKPPLRGTSAVDTMMMHQTTQPPTLKEASGGQEFPEMLEKLIATLLAKAPMDRYQNMERVGQDLALIKGGQQLQINPFATNNPALEATPLIPTSSFGAITGSAPGLAQTSTGIRRPRQTSAFDNNSADAQLLRDKYNVQHDEADLHHQNNNLIKIISLAGAAFVLAGTCFGGYLWWTEGQKPKIKKAAPLAAPARVGFDSGDMPLADVVTPNVAGNLNSGNNGDRALEKKPDKSLNDTAPYVRIVREGDHYLKVFNFPDDFLMGYVNSKSLGGAGAPAKGEITFGLEQQIKFSPNPLLAHYPQYVKRFKANDIYSLALRPGRPPIKVSIEEQLKIAEQLDGLKELHFESLKALTPPMVQTVNRLSGLEGVFCESKSFDPKTMLALKNLRTYQAVGCSAETSPTPLLMALKGDKAIRRLWLDHSRLSMQDMELLATMPNLDGLSIEKSTYDDRTFRKLTELKLKGLNLEGSPINLTKGLALQKMHLREISVGENDLDNISEDGLAKILVGTQLNISHDVSDHFYANE